MSEPRVLFVTGEYPPLAGGVGDYTANLRLALAGMGIRTAVLSSRGAGGEDVWTVRRWGWPSILSVERATRRARASIVHIQYQAGAFAMHPAVTALPALVGERFPVVTTFHDLRVPYLFPKAGRLRKAAITRMARSSTAVVVTNLADERALANEGINANSLPIGPNLPPPVPGVRVDGRAVAFFGFPARSKGIEQLLNALADLPEHRLSLLLVGDQGKPRPSNDIISGQEIDRLAARAGVELRRTGFLDPRAASNALASARVIVLPFRDGASQGSGSLLAALQSGRPVVTTAPRFASDLGELAPLPQLRLAPPDDPAALAAAIEGAL
ncbi:MAG: glycosyltransferase, partial [Vicinamibacterales bacterium]